MKGLYPKVETAHGNEPLCCQCDQLAVWQIGNYQLFRSKPTFFCEEHFPSWAREAYREQQEMENEAQA